MRCVLLPLFCITLIATVAFGAAPYQVIDLRTVPNGEVSSSPYYTRAFNGIALFTATDAAGTSQVWRTDGTSGGTFPLTRAGQVTGFAYPASKSALYIVIYQGSAYQLVKIDSGVTAAAAVTQPDPVPFFPYFVGESLLLTKDTGLYATDAGTNPQLIATIHTRTAAFTSFVPAGSFAYVGTESGLWRTDGTAAGTKQLATAPSFHLALAGNRLFFAGGAIDSGTELWVSDGTAAGTHIVTDLNPGQASTFSPDLLSAIVPFGSGVIFLGGNGEIGVSDGTAAGTQILRKGKASTPAEVQTLNGVAYFGFNDGTGRRLWRSDGTADGTRPVGSVSGLLHPLMIAGSHLFFYGSDSNHSDDFFQSDGTDAGTHVVHEGRGTSWRGTYNSLYTATSLGDRVLFAADDGVHGIEPWISDGSEAGTHLLANIATEGAGSSTPFNFFVFGNRLAFAAVNDTVGGFWLTDGTAAGTVPFLTTSGILPKIIGVAGGNIFLQTASGALMKSDGTPGSETLVSDQLDIQEAWVINDRLYLRALSKGSGNDELWTSDGTPFGTLLLTHLNDWPLFMAGLAGRTYFLTANSGIFGATDGTIQGTRTIVEKPDRSENSLAPLTPLGGSLVTISAPSGEAHFWKFSGSADDATRFHAQVTSYFGTTVPVSIGSTLLYRWALDPSRVNQLWKTDGTDAGTLIVHEFPASTDPPTMTSLCAVGGRAVFGVDDGVHGVEPWVSDGTPDGTKLLRDINPSGSSSPDGFVVAGGIVYFAATDPDHGRELWQTDGTPEGTQLVADIAPGPASSNPYLLTPVGNLLYFGATTNEFGTELWAYPLPDAGVTIDDVRASESAGTINVPIRLTQPSTRTITVTYATGDDSAKAGSDYTATSGTLTFAPGETSKNVAIPITNDSIPGTTRSFYVFLKSANAPIERAAGAAIIEDDDVITDVSVSLTISGSVPLLSVQNAGPSAASNIQLCDYSVGYGGDVIHCELPFELAPGESRRFFIDSSQGPTVLARVTQWERDSNPSNNEMSALVNGFLTVTPAVLRVGQGAILTIISPNTAFDVPMHLTSSDPSVVALPDTITIPAGAASFLVPFIAAKAGVTTLTATFINGSSALTLHVVGASDPLRILPTITFDPMPSGWVFGKPNRLAVTILGMTLDGAKATGTVTFAGGGRILGTAPVAYGKAVTTVLDPPVTQLTITAAYSGDANFFDTTRAYGLLPQHGTPVFGAVQIAGTNNVSIVLHGIAGHAPTGTVTVTENGAPRSVTSALVPSADGRSTTTATGFSPGARTVTVSYSGDDVWDAVSATVPITEVRGRTVRH